VSRVVIESRRSIFAINRSLQKRSSTTSLILAAADACTFIAPVTWCGSGSARDVWQRALRNRMSLGKLGKQLYGRAEPGHFLTASRMSPHPIRGRLLRSQWRLTVVCETPVSHGRERGKTQPFEAPGVPISQGLPGLRYLRARWLSSGLGSLEKGPSLFPSAFRSHSLRTLSPARSAIPMGSVRIGRPQPARDGPPWSG